MSIMLSSFINPHEKHLEVLKTEEAIFRIQKFDDKKSSENMKCSECFCHICPLSQSLIYSDNVNSQHSLEVVFGEDKAEA